MNPGKVIALLIFCHLFVMNISAQDNHHSHEHLLNEIGLNMGATYSHQHREWGTGVHVHYFRTLKPHGKLALGGSLEQVWSDGDHYNISAGIKYMATHRLSLGIMPGVTFLKHKHDHNDEDGHEDHSSERETKFAMHFEIVYDLFHFDRFHLGPAADYSWAKGDSHYMIGIHAAYCF